MKKKKYVKPETGHITVELEGTICSSILDKKNKVSTQGHEVGNSYGFDINDTGEIVSTNTGDGATVEWEK